jgi:predicted nucleic acid-binding protein
MKISAALSGVHKLCIETSPFIYYTERYPVYVDKMRAIFVPIQQGQIEVFTSTVTLTEVLTKPLKAGDSRLIKAYREMLRNTQNITLVPVDDAVAERAAELRARYNLKTPDALQVAVAIESGCDAFLTNDLGLKRVTELQILVLDELQVDTP